MKAVVFKDKGAIEVADVPQPTIDHPTDAIVNVAVSAICGSDLHVLSGRTPGMRPGSVIGHEFVGTVADAGAGVDPDLLGRRVVGSFLIACGSCRACQAQRFNHCEERRALGLGKLTGDLDGAQAELVRVPNGSINLKPLSGSLAELSDEAALFAGDIMATGFYASSLAGLRGGEAAVVIGAGPVGIMCALALRREGTGSVIVVDQDPARVLWAREELGLNAVDVAETSPEAAVAEATSATMAGVVVEAVGALDAFKSALRCVRDGGRVVVVGVYGSERYELPMGVMWARGLEVRWAGMANVHAHWGPALEAVQRREVDPTSLITHRMSLVDSPEAYELFAQRRAMKVVLRP